MRIGLVLNVLNEEYQISVYTGVKKECDKLGIELVCFQLEGIQFSKESFASKFPSNAFFDIDGIILVTSSLVDGYKLENKEVLQKLWPGIQTVSMGQEIENIPSVQIQTDTSMKLLIEHLVRVHHYENFLFLGGYQTHKDSEERKYIFKKTLQVYKNWIPDITYEIKNGDFSEVYGTQAMEDYYEEHNKLPDVVVCANDNMAIGVLKFFKIDRRTSLQCAVTGFDDIPQSKFMVPALTTVRQPLTEAGSLSVDICEKMIKNEPVDSVSFIESSVVIRDSCGCTTNNNIVNEAAKHVEEIQSKYLQSEQLLRILSYIGQALIFCQTETQLRQILDNYLKQLEVDNFYFYSFVDEIFDDQMEDVNNLPVHPVYVRANGEFQEDYYDIKSIPLNHFMKIMEERNQFTRNNKIVKFTNIGNKLLGCVIYEGDKGRLPFLCSICISISQALLRIRNFEQEQQRAEFLEKEVTKRTRELVEANNERMKVEAEVLKISEIERQRFSLDLHDDICQRLAGISMLCRSYSRMEDGIDNSQMVELAELINDTLQRTRQYAHNSYPVELESLGLNHSISNLCNSFYIQNEIKCDYQWNVEEKIVFSNIQKLNIFRIIQEALHNVQKHANATEIVVSIHNENNRVIINVCDNGKGFNTSKQIKKGLGVTSMEYRANQIGAMFFIEPNTPKGTKITVMIDM